MNSSKSTQQNTIKCQVCGGANKNGDNSAFYRCYFCGFKKSSLANCRYNNDQLIYAEDVNQFFKDKYNNFGKGEIFTLSVPVRRFYKTPTPMPNQINFFTSKNIMFLLEQHGFQLVSRKSRFSVHLNLIVRRV